MWLRTGEAEIATSEELEILADCLLLSAGSLTLAAAARGGAVRAQRARRLSVAAERGAQNGAEAGKYAQRAEMLHEASEKWRRLSVRDVAPDLAHAGAAAPDGVPLTPPKMAPPTTTCDNNAGALSLLSNRTPTPLADSRIPPLPLWALQTPERAHLAAVVDRYNHREETAGDVTPPNRAYAGAQAVYQALEELGLEQYAPTLVDEKGYDSLDHLLSLDFSQRARLASSAGMKEGHALRFVQMLSITSRGQPEEAVE